MMYARQFTPPSADTYLLPDSAKGYPSPNSFYNSSPDSAVTNKTHLTTPERSPTIIQNGPTLLPKIRSQDQVIEPSSGPMAHSRHASAASSSFQASLYPLDRYHRPTIARRETSPPSATDLYSPASSLISPSSVQDSLYGSALNSPVVFNPQSRRPSLAHARSSSTSAVRSQKGHSRSASSGSVDEGILRFGYPTYRNLPQYITTSTASTTASTMTATADYSAGFPQAQSFNYVPQLQMPQAPRATQMLQYPVSQYAAAQSFAADIPFDAVTGTSATTCLMDYLTAQNPTPMPIRRIVAQNSMSGLHPWFDVRNLRSWEDFTTAKITSIDGILRLLQVAVNEVQLPVPVQSHAQLQPETESALRNMYRDHHLAKVNAALVVAQGDKHMVMRTAAAGTSGRPQPDFVSNMQSDYEKTIYGDGRGRVVGIVRSYNQWNTSMRSGSQEREQIQYLAGLAALHYHMREHGCRYGFIITEIELLCVRAGGPHTSEPADPYGAANHTPPLFGYLEVSKPISMSTKGIDADTGLPRMTVEFALWYLNMLAKDSPLPGALSWRMHVGLPAELTRQKCLERDTWMAKINIKEARVARQTRGWALPGDPLNKKEHGRVRRARR